jgi:type IV secretion system protein VirB10
MAYTAPPPEDDDDEIEPVPFWRRPRVLLVGGVGVLLAAFIFTRGKAPPKQDELAKKDSFIGVVVPYQPAQAEPAPPAPVTKPAPPPEPVKVAQAPPPPQAAPAPQPAPPTPPQAPAFRMPVPMPPGVAAKPARPVMLSYAVHVEPARPTPPGPAEPAQTGVSFKASSIPGLKAGPAMDTTLMLLPGLLPVELDTAIRSDLPGDLIGHLPGPVYSNKGVLLLPAGTQIIGHYDSVKNGQTRLMAPSVYAITPDGVPVPLTGQNMTDNLGRNGLDGAVDAHLMDRFGAAILLTLTQSVLGIIQAEASQGGNTYLSIGQGGGGSGIGGVAQQILQSQINIAPTLSKNQGEMVAILLDQPIDFSNAYRIREAR